MIELKGVSKVFGTKKLFTDINLKISKNKMTALVGQSGSGKTTLLNLIGLMDLEYQGEISVFDIKLKSLRGRKRSIFIRNNINYLFQDYALIESETVEYNLMLALEYCKMSKEDKKKCIKEALEMMGLTGFEKNYIYTLSGGEQQRVALARAMIKPGDILLTDEPTGNLDDVTAERIFKLLEQLRDKGKTIIIVTHDKSLADRCDQVVYLEQL